MPKWTVHLPIAGSVIVNDVEAETQKEAIEAAFELANFRLVADDPSRVDFGEMDTFRILAEGNVLRAPLNRAHAEPADDN